MMNIEDWFKCLIKNKDNFFTMLCICFTMLCIKTSDKPFYAFLSGGGGSIYPVALKNYNARAGEDFRCTHKLLLTPTKKTAYLIKDKTIHSALAIPASQSLKNYKPPNSGRLNTLRCELGALKFYLMKYQ